MPDFDMHPDTGFAMPDKPQASTLALSVEGRFQSYFAKQSEALAAGIKTQSPDTARVVLVASNSFGSDLAIDIVSRGMGALYTAPTAFLQNAVDWSLEDSTLLSLRGRSQTAHTLDPVGAEAQQIWEGANYVLALLGLGLVGLLRRLLLALRARRYRSILKEVGA